MSKLPTTLASVLHVVASGLFSIHFTFLACCDDPFLCSKLKKKTSKLSSNQHPWPFGPVWSPAKYEMWWDCWFPGFSLTIISQKYWIFALRSGSCQIKTSTYFPVVRKTSLQIRWVRSGWWLHACSQCWRTVKDDILELANTSWNPVSQGSTWTLLWPLTLLIHSHGQFVRLCIPLIYVMVSTSQEGENGPEHWLTSYLHRKDRKGELLKIHIKWHESEQMVKSKQRCDSSNCCLQRADCTSDFSKQICHCWTEKYRHLPRRPNRNAACQINRINQQEGF